MHYPEMTKRYLDAMRQQGDDFDPIAWNRQRRAANTSATNQEITMEQAGNAQSQLNVLVACQIGPQPDAKLMAPKKIADAGEAVPCTKLPARDDLKRLCAVWQQSRTAGRRDAIYPYLKRVYCLVQKYRTAGELSRLTRSTQKLAGVRRNLLAEPYAAVVRGTTSGQIDRRQVSKFSRALRYARQQKVRGKSVIDLIQGCGGINACAGLFRTSGLKRRGR